MGGPANRGGVGGGARVESVAERRCEPDYLHRVASLWTSELSQTPVEGRQASDVPNGQSEQMGIGDLSVTDDALEWDGLRISR